MCFFLTIAVPAKHVDRIGEMFGRGFQSYQSLNATITAALPPDHVAYHVTSGMCSCDLYARPNSRPDSDPMVHLRRKYEKRGWSESKIARAIEQTEASRSKSARAASGLRADVVER